MSASLYRAQAGGGEVRLCAMPTNREAASGLMLGSRVQTEHGSINYKLWSAGGVQARPLVVTIHGLLGTMETFRLTAERLVAFGYDVLTFDLFGFGLSDSPHMKFQVDLYVQQSLQLLSSLGYPDTYSFYLVGFSMGGLIAAELARQTPQRVKRLVMVAPAGMVKLGRAARYGIRALRIARSLRIPVASLVGKSSLPKAKSFDFTPDMMTQTQSQEERCHTLESKYKKVFNSNPQKYSKAWLKSVRDIGLGDSHAVYQGLAKCGVQIMFIWGDSDAVVPLTEIEDDLRELFPKAPVLEIEDAGHGLLGSPQYSNTIACSAAQWFKFG